MMPMVLVRLEKQVPVQVRNKVYRTPSIFIFLRSQNQWHRSALLLAGEKNIIDYIRYNIRRRFLPRAYQCR